MIQVGDRVRSFDFVRGDHADRDLEGERACYVEGVVEEFAELEGCPRYAIRVEVDIFGGVRQGACLEGRVSSLVYPPVNGTPTLFGGACNYVELV